MLLHRFPNLAWLKQQIATQFEAGKAWNNEALKHRGWPTVILNAKTTEIERPNVEGPLSLFTNVSGKSRVAVEGKTVTIDPGFFFLTNPQQYYSLEIDSAETVETFNIHFGEHHADQVWQSLTQSPEEALDTPFSVNLPMAFHNRLYRRNDYVDQLITYIHAEAPTMMKDPLWMEEQLYALMAYFLQQELNWNRQIQDLPALKSSTKKELARRLALATDYMYAHVCQAPALEDLAQVAMLSKYHFLRLFKVFYGKTPQQMLAELRVEKAQNLLTKDTLSVLDIALEVGLSEGSALSRLFYKHTGMYPSQYRQLVKN